jgi:DNA (cytosine-5)-methyltransferase 1
MVKKYDMQIIDVFSGIGGFSIAGKIMGWRTIQFVEIDKFCQLVLKSHFPGIPIHDNIKTFNYEILQSNPLYNPHEPIIVVGGPPCQPFSLAGQRTGTDDDRYLWREFVNTVREVSPRWVVAENVPGLLSWNRGMVLDTVLSDLENEGYQTLPPLVLPACSVNVPHRRDRVFLVAYSASEGLQKREQNIRRSYSSKNRTRMEYEFKRFGGMHATSDTMRKRQWREKHWKKKSRRITKTSLSNDWSNFPTQSPVCTGNDGLSSRLVRFIRRNGADLLTEKEINTIVSKTISKVRKEGIKAGGNAVVPPLILQLFKTIEKIDNDNLFN